MSKDEIRDLIEFEIYSKLNVDIEASDSYLIVSLAYDGTLISEKSIPISNLVDKIKD